MQARGVSIEAQPNRAFRQPDGSLCLVLDAGDVFLLGAVGDNNAGLAALEHSWSMESETRCFRCRVGIAMPGSRSAARRRRRCSPRSAPWICASTISRIWPSPRPSPRVSTLLRYGPTSADARSFTCCRIAAQYMLTCLLDAAAEFGGRLAGYQTLLDTAASETFEGYG
jgi:hypothetical protein